MARIAVGGFQHETNTFAPVKAGYAAFANGGAWPALSRGEEMRGAVAGVHLPVAGALQRLAELGHTVAPLGWSAATPSAHVTEDAFERIAGMLLDELAAAAPVDGVYLDLHGAMVCEHLEDGEGELLARVRSLVGPDVPVAASLDLHANLTEAMVRGADVLDLFRTYPHVDMAETGARTASHLHAMLVDDTRWHVALRRTEFLIPLNWGCTLTEPAGSLYRDLPDRIVGDVRALGLACGFPLADIAEVGPGVVAYADDGDSAEAAADALCEAVGARETEFAGEVWAPADAVSEAMRLRGAGRGPVVLADSQDNPGGGGPGDTTGVLRALVEGGARGAVVACISDPRSAAAAHEAGTGTRVDLRLGERSALPGHVPYEGRFRVLALGDGAFTATGPMYRGSRMTLGPTALLETEGVRVIVTSRAAQTADRSILRHVGVEPEREGILALKSSVHFRADFQPIASAILVVAASGPVSADPSTLRFRRARPDLRLSPGSPGQSS